MLATMRNPFATLTLLHRDTQEARSDPQERVRRKIMRYRALLRQGYNATDIRMLLCLMEHLLRLTPDLAYQARDAMRQVEEEELGMDTFITSFEEIARNEERRTLILRQLPHKVGPLPPPLLVRVEQLSPDQLLDLSEALFRFADQAALEAWLDQAGATD